MTLAEWWNRTRYRLYAPVYDRAARPREAGRRRAIERLEPARGGLYTVTLARSPSSRNRSVDRPGVSSNASSTEPEPGRLSSAPDVR